MNNAGIRNSGPTNEKRNIVYVSQDFWQLRERAVVNSIKRNARDTSSYNIDPPRRSTDSASCACRVLIVLPAAQPVTVAITQNNPEAEVAHATIAKLPKRSFSTITTLCEAGLTGRIFVAAFSNAMNVKMMRRF